MASPVNEAAKNALKSNQCDTITFVLYNWNGGFLSHCYLLDVHSSKQEYKKNKLLKKYNRNVTYNWTGGIIIPCRGICPLYTFLKLFNYLNY